MTISHTTESVVVFHWQTPKGFESSHAKKKLLARWSLTCKAFGVHSLYCVSDEDMEIKDTEILFETFTTLNEALRHTEGMVVYLEQNGSSLSEFKHPESAVYVFGSDYGCIEEDGVISIDSRLPVHAEVAAGIVLSHRYSQWP